MKSQIILKVKSSNENLKLSPFLGKRVLYVNKLKNKKGKMIWGKITSFHGRSGAFLARFDKTLPPLAFSSHVYITPLPAKGKMEQE